MFHTVVNILFTAAAVNAAGLADTLSGDGTFTVFAPPNSAFEQLPADLLAKLLEPQWQPQLKDIILYHALGNKVLSTDLEDGLTVTTLNGEDITISTDPLSVNDHPIIVDLADVEADNGVVHGISSVLAPASLSSDIVDIASGNEAFSTLVAAVTAAGLVDALKGEGPLTVFGEKGDSTLGVTFHMFVKSHTDSPLCFLFALFA